MQGACLSDESGAKKQTFHVGGRPYCEKSHSRLIENGQFTHVLVESLKSPYKLVFKLT